MTDKPMDSIVRDLLASTNSRREFIKQASVFGIGATAAASMFSMPSVWAATPKKGGTLRLAASTGGVNDFLDPTKYIATGDYARGYQIYSPLIALSREGGPLPALAISWEPNSNATEWTFKLRRGVEWSDGKKFTSKDVLYSLGRHTAPDSESPGKPLLEQVTEMKADGDLVVVMTLKNSNADLPIVFTDPRFQITQEGEDKFQSPASIGPYLLTEFKPGIRTVLTRNDSYWGGPSYLDSIVISIVLDSTARMNALMAGKVDIADSADHKLLDLLRNAPGIELVASKSSQHTNLVMMCDREPTNNNDVRLAMKYVIPRQQIVDNVFKGFGQIGNDHQVAPNDPFYCHDIPQRQYDPDKAKYHLNKAGMNSLTIKLHTSDQATVGSEAIALLCKEAAKPAGLNYEVVNVPPGSYWQTAWMQQPFVVSGWNPRPTADLMLTTANKSDGSWNETQWKNERFDKLLIEARGELDVAKRQEMYCEMQRMLHDDGGVGMMAYYDYIDARRSNVMGFEPHPAGFARNAFFGTELWLDN